MTNTQSAICLTALRHFQSYLMSGGQLSDYADILEGTEITEEIIDELCETLNCSSEAPSVVIADDDAGIYVQLFATAEMANAAALNLVRSPRENTVDDLLNKLPPLASDWGVAYSDLLDTGYDVLHSLSVESLAVQHEPPETV